MQILVIFTQRLFHAVSLSVPDVILEHGDSLRIEVILRNVVLRVDAAVRFQNRCDLTEVCLDSAVQQIRIAHKVRLLLRPRFLDDP